MLAALLTNLDGGQPVIPVVPVPPSGGGGPDHELWKPKAKRQDAVQRDDLEDIVAIIIALAEASGP